MIKTRTVLVLGAGASHAYGYPLGSQLRKEILDMRSESFIAQSCQLNSHPQFDLFTKAFLRSRLYSIDAFLALNEQYSNVGKMAIAAVLIHFEQASVHRLLSGEQYWYDYLWNRLASGHTWEQLSFANLSIVTFNYDRSLEFYLLEAIKGTYQVTNEQATEKLRSLKILHVYGHLGSPWPGTSDFRTYGMQLNAGNVHGCAEGLKVIPETREDEPAFREAQQLLNEARAICFLGFGFDVLNLRRLDSRNTCGNSSSMSSSKDGRMIAASCMGRTGAEARADAVACGVQLHSPGPPSSFVDGDCLTTLRETLILETTD